MFTLVTWLLRVAFVDNYDKNVFYVICQRIRKNTLLTITLLPYYLKINQRHIDNDKCICCTFLLWQQRIHTRKRRMHPSIHTLTHARTHARTHASTLTHSRTHARTHAHTHTNAHAQTRNLRMIDIAKYCERLT